jgi:hypothetical protein
MRAAFSHSLLRPDMMEKDVYGVPFALWMMNVIAGTGAGEVVALC